MMRLPSGLLGRVIVYRRAHNIHRNQRRENLKFYQANTACVATQTVRRWQWEPRRAGPISCSCFLLLEDNRVLSFD